MIANDGHGVSEEMMPSKNIGAQTDLAKPDQA
jgi:hypothetical protein